MFKAAFEAEELQRQKVAVNLHDEVIPLLAVLKQNISRYQKEQSPDTLRAADFNTDIRLIEQSIKGIQTIGLDRVPPFLFQFGLLKVIQDHTGLLNNTGAIV